MTDMTDQRSIRALHADMVRSLKKDPDTIPLSPGKVDAIHMVLGIAGEAGELVDAVKKWAIYGKELDMGNVVEELGDLEFYMEGLRQQLGIPRPRTLEKNRDKLLTGKKARYKEGTYSDAAAHARADKR